MEFLLLSRRRFSLRNVPSSEEHGEMALLSGYRFSVNNMIIRWPAEAKRKKKQQLWGTLFQVFRYWWSSAEWRGEGNAEWERRKCLRMLPCIPSLDELFPVPWSSPFITLLILCFAMSQLSEHLGQTSSGIGSNSYQAFKILEWILFWIDTE